MWRKQIILIVWLYLMRFPNLFLFKCDVIICLVRFLMPQTQPEREGTSSWVLWRKTHIRSEDVWIWFSYWNIISCSCSSRRGVFRASIKLLRQPSLSFINLNRNVNSLWDHFWFCFQVFFVESLCDDPEVIAANILVSVTVNIYHCCYIRISCRG